jgi:hypothetical protein
MAGQKEPGEKKTVLQGKDGSYNVKIWAVSASGRTQAYIL